MRNSVLFGFFLLAASFLSTTGYSQEDSVRQKESYFVTGLGGIHQTNYDQRMTNLIYNGFGGGIYGRAQDFGDGWESQFLFSAQGAFTNRTSFGESSPYISLRGHFAFRNLYDLKNKHWRIGYALSQDFNYRLFSELGNSRQNIDDFSSLEFNAAWYHDFELWNRDFILDIHLRVPLVSYVFRIPEYAVVDRATQWSFPWDYQRIQLSTELIIPFKRVPQNRWSIQYSWDFYAFQQRENIHDLMIAQHALTFHYWMKTR